MLSIVCLKLQTSVSIKPTEPSCACNLVQSRVPKTSSVPTASAVATAQTYKAANRSTQSRTARHGEHARPRRPGMCAPAPAGAPWGGTHMLVLRCSLRFFVRLFVCSFACPHHFFFLFIPFGGTRAAGGAPAHPPTWREQQSRRRRRRHDGPG